MGYFKTEKYTDENGDEWLMFHPTIHKTGEDVMYIEGKDEIEPIILINKIGDVRKNIIEKKPL